MKHTQENTMYKCERCGELFEHWAMVDSYICLDCSNRTSPTTTKTHKGEVTMKMDAGYCKCDRPKIRIHYYDLGRPVKYCDKCWNVVKERKFAK